MITYSSALSTLQTTTGVASTDTTNSATLIQFWNDSRRTVGNMRGGNWPWREFEKTVDTVASQDYVYTPNDMEKVTGVRFVVGTGTSATIYLPKLIFDVQKWQTILAARLGSNVYPYFCFQQGQKLIFSPIPSVTGTDVVLIGRRAIRDMNIADITSSTVTSITNGATAMVISAGGVASMAGRYIRITESDTTNKGDGYWYEIASATATTITLVKPYQGTTIAAGAAACVIGQITYEPEAYQMAPIYRATAQYWDLKENMVLSERYWNLYDGGCEIGKRDLPAGLIGQMLEAAAETFDGAYIPPSDGDISNLMNVPYYFPTQEASGF